MKPSEKIKQIDNREYAYEKRCSCGLDVPWLIARVKKLTEALEKISKQTVDNDWTETTRFCIRTARKALGDE